MLPCVPHLINIAQLGGLRRKEQRGIWRAGEAVFAHESEILSEVPAEPERGCARQIAASGRGDAELAVGSGEATFAEAFPMLCKKRSEPGEGWQGDGWRSAVLGPGSPRRRLLGAGACLGNCKHILKI